MNVHASWYDRWLWFNVWGLLVEVQWTWPFCWWHLLSFGILVGLEEARSAIFHVDVFGFGFDVRVEV